MRLFYGFHQGFLRNSSEVSLRTTPGKQNIQAYLYYTEDFFVCDTYFTLILFGVQNFETGEADFSKNHLTSIHDHLNQTMD